MNTKNDSRQNVVLIVCDQLRSDFLGVYGADFIDTPNIDALAADGVTFDNAITAATVCGPARASLMTGELVSTHGAWTNLVPCKEGTVYLPERMREAGYITAATGNYDHSPVGNPMGYQYRQLFLGVKAESDYTRYLKAKHPEATGFNHSEDGLHFKYDEEDFYDRWATDRAVEFIDCYSKTGTAPDGTAPDEEGAPFFLYCGYVSPHTPYTPPKEISGRVDGDKLPKTRTTMRFEDLPDVERNRMTYLTPHEALVDPETIMPQRTRERLAYGELVVEVDDLVGRIVKSLKENGIYENTTIIFTSDHGSMENDYNLVDKGPWPYKAQLFIPLIVANNPRLEKGTRCDCLCGNLDVGATALDVAGDERAFGISRSLIGTADGTIPEREVNISEFCDACKNLVDKRYTFSYYPFTGKTCLYDRLEDPDETVNLGGRPEYAEIERKFLMHAMDFMAIAKGVRIEAHDLIPIIRKGIEKKHPKFLENFPVAFPLTNEVELERLRLAGLPNDYCDFCLDREVVATYSQGSIFSKKKWGGIS